MQTYPAAHGEENTALATILTSTADEARDELRRADTKAAAFLHAALAALAATGLLALAA